MKLRSEKSELHAALATAARASASGSASVVLSGLLVRLEGERLTITGTDLDLTLRTEIEVVGLGDGSCVVPAKLVTDIVHSMPDGAVTLEKAEDNRLTVSGARSRFTVRTFPVEEFPKTEEAVDGETIDVDVDQFSGALRQIVRAASKDEARPLLTAVLIASDGGDFRLVATDSYRLAIRDLDHVSGFGEHKAVLVPARGMAELARLGASLGKGGGKIRLGAGGHWASAEAGKVVLRTRTIAGEYPDYGQLVPSSFATTFTAGKETFMSALKRVAVVANTGQGLPTRLSIREGGVDLSVASTEVGDATESVDGDLEGEELVINFSGAYLLDGLDAVQGDEIKLQATEASRPAMITGPDSPGFRYLLMPIRVQ